MPENNFKLTFKELMEELNARNFTSKSRQVDPKTGVQPINASNHITGDDGETEYWMSRELLHTNDDGSKVYGWTRGSVREQWSDEKKAEYRDKMQAKQEKLKAKFSDTFDE